MIAIARAIKTCHANTVEPVHSDHPSEPNKLAAIERWPDYTVTAAYIVVPYNLTSWLKAPPPPPPPPAPNIVQQN